MSQAVVSSRKTSRAKSAGRSSARSAVPKNYLAQSQLPLTCLAFLAVPMVLYELGSRSIQLENIAFRLLEEFFQIFGVYGRWVPALAVCGILLAWHIARRDAWQINLRVLAIMVIESAAWAVPLLCVGWLLYSRVPLSTGWGSAAILSIGAGVYEELVFRLMAFTLLHFILKDWLKIPDTKCYLCMVVFSAICFSFYHYLGHEVFHLRTFVFRMVAGIYFGSLFLVRGFGITCGSHIGYDILVATVSVLR